MQRPQAFCSGCAKRTGLDGIDLYYAFDFSGVIGVAVCDTPAGKYEYYGNVHYEDGTVLGTREDDYFSV